MTFGFVNPAKGISAVLAAASIHGFAVNAQWPTSSAWERRLISRAWDHAGVRGKLEFGFLDEDRLMESMSMCDFVFLPQGSLPYYSVSGSVRLALSMGMPVLTSAARQFEGLEVCTYVVAEGALDPAMTWISIPDNRRDLSTHALTYARANSIPSVYRRALMTQVGSPVPDPRKALTEIRLSSPPAREARLTFVPLGAKVWAHRLLDRWQVCAAALGLWPLDRALRRAGG